MPENKENFKNRRINPAIIGIPALEPVLTYTKEEISPFGKRSIDDAEVGGSFEVDVDSGDAGAGAGGE